MMLRGQLPQTHKHCPDIADGHSNADRRHFIAQEHKQYEHSYPGKKHQRALPGPAVFCFVEPHDQEHHNKIQHKRRNQEDIFRKSFYMLLPHEFQSRRDVIQRQDQEHVQHHVGCSVGYGVPVDQPVVKDPVNHKQPAY